jgi:hypothetical protein
MKRRISLIAVIVCCISLVAGCSKDASISRKIDGRWIANQFTVDGASWIGTQVYVDLDKDGTFIFSNDGDLYPGEWSVDGERLELLYPGGEGVVAYGSVEVYDIIEIKRNNLHFEGNVEGDFVIFKGVLEK